MHLIYQSRLLRLLALLWFSAALLAACSQEPKQRAAFIGFLQTRVIDVKGPVLPLLTKQDRDTLGDDYAKQYEVIQSFHQELNQVINSPANKLTSMGNLGSLSAIVKRRGDLQGARENLKQLRSTLDASLAKADAARASFQQPEDLKPVYDKAYEKSVSKPAAAFKEMLPLLDEMFTSVDKVADYAEQHKEQIKMLGSIFQVSDAKVLMEINALIDESNKKGQAVMAAQRNFMQVINGG